MFKSQPCLKAFKGISLFAEPCSIYQVYPLHTNLHFSNLGVLTYFIVFISNTIFFHLIILKAHLNLLSNSWIYLIQVATLNKTRCNLIFLLLNSISYHFSVLFIVTCLFLSCIINICVHILSRLGINKLFL